MRILRRLLYGLVLLVILLAVFGLFLPDSAHLERSVEIDAEAEEIFPQLNDLKAFNDWAPWRDRDPDTVYRYEGPATGVGSKVFWQSEHPSVGSGSQEIIESLEPEFVKTALDFGAQCLAEAYFRLESTSNGTRVTWGFDTEFGFNIMGRYFGLMLESMLAPDYEAGLRKLKALVEST